MSELHNIIVSPNYAFIRMAFWVSALASLSFGVIGTFVVVRRIGYIAGAISHCAFGGIGVGLFLRQTVSVGFFGAVASKTFTPWIDPIVVAIFVAVLCALVIGAVQLYGKEREDTIIGAIWSIGMAIGLLFLDRTSGYNQISSYLFGDIFLISWTDVYLVGTVSAVVLGVFSLCFQRFSAVCFDEEFAKLRGLRTGFYYQLLLVLTAVTVVLMIRVVGIILVIAMLTLPAATAGRLTKRLFPMCVLSVVLCLLCSWIGLYLGVLLNFSAAPMIILVAAAAYVAAFGVRLKFV